MAKGKSHSPNDMRSINLNPQHPGGSKNLSHNATQGPATPSAEAPAPVGPIATTPPPKAAT